MDAIEVTTDRTPHPDGIAVLDEAAVATWHGRAQAIRSDLDAARLHGGLTVIGASPHDPAQCVFLAAYRLGDDTLKAMLRCVATSLVARLRKSGSDEEAVIGVLSDVIIQALGGPAPDGPEPSAPQEPQTP